MFSTNHVIRFDTAAPVNAPPSGFGNRNPCFYNPTIPLGFMIAK